MNFAALQANLRRILLQRIQRGELTGTKVARLTGYRQPHVSNFLHGKRGLSVEALDRMLAALGMTVTNLLDPWELDAIPPLPQITLAGHVEVPLVRSLGALTVPRFLPTQVREILQLQRTYLEALRPDLVPSAAGDRSNWIRFVMVEVDARQGMAMYPRLLPGARVLVDRHYTSLHPYQRQEDNLYAVRKGRQRLLRYVRWSQGSLILRPENRAYPVESIAVKAGDATPYLLGRVCRVEMET